MDIKDTPEFNTYPITIEVDTGTASPENPQANTPAVVPENSNILNSANGSIVGTGTVQSPNFAPGAAGWRLDSNGNLDANNGTFKGNITGATGTFSGTITAAAGTIGGWSINGTSIYTGTEDHSGYTANAGDLTIYSNGTDASIHAKEFYIDANGAIFATSATLSGAITTGVGSSIASDYLSGIIAQANLNVSNRGWSQTCAFTVTDADTIAWGAGTLTSADGTAYSITGANTGNMAAKTYIYLDTAVSTTAYQTTTTATTAVGVGKVLVAIAQNGTTEATFKVMKGQGGENIDAANIVAGSITANEIAASTITAGKMSVSTLASIVADLGAITAGTITIDTAGYIRGGQTAYNTGTGFFLGYSGAAYKFSIGVPTGDYLIWDGTNLTVSASKIVKLFTAGIALTAGEVVYMATDGKVYSADATYAATTNKAFGICLTTTAINGSAPIQTFGTASGLSSLTIASTYYLQNATHTIDQQDTTNSGSGQVIGTGENRYQSFTTGAGITNISAVQIRVDGVASETITLRIRTGQGTGGTLLASGSKDITAAGAANEIIYLDYPATLSALTQYSYTLESSGSTMTVREDNTNQYAGGRCDMAAGTDYMFKTYVSSARGALGTSAGTVSKIMGFATSATELQLNYQIT